MKRFFIVILVLMMLLTSVSCASKSIEKEVIGAWVCNKFGSVFILEFSKDGFTLVVIDESSGDVEEDDEGTYSIDEENCKIHLRVTDNGIDPEATWEYAYKDEELYIKAPYSSDDETIYATFNKITDKQLKHLKKLLQNGQWEEFLQEIVAQ